MDTLERMKTLGYGTELEYTGISRGAAAKAVWSVVGGCFKGTEVVANDGRIWRAIKDGSLSGSDTDQAAEVVTPILRYEDLGTLEAVVRALRRAGAQASADTSQHVHVGVENFSVSQIANLVRIFFKQEELIIRAVGIWNERLYRYCRRTDPDFIARLEAIRPTTPEELDEVWYANEPDRHLCRYRALNLSSLWKTGTVEFRCYNGTLRPDMVRATVVLSLAIAARALEVRKTTSKHQRIYSPESARYDMRIFLSGLGLNGLEFQAVRQSLLENLSGCSAWKSGRPQQSFRRKRPPKKIKVTTPLK